MNFGIVVEDIRDGEAYSELIRKIREDVQEIVSYPCHGSSTLKKQFLNGLKYFKWYAPNSPYAIDKALVIVDSDCSEASVWETTLAKIQEREHFEAGFPVHFHATKCELETWLLADENAMSQTSQLRGKNKQVSATKIQFESYKDAKELFQRRLSEAKLQDTPKVYREIAAHADITRIAAKCSRFTQFVQKVKAC